MSPKVYLEIAQTCVIYQQNRSGQYCAMRDISTHRITASCITKPDNRLSYQCHIPLIIWTRGTLLIYKQMILPLIDYADFMIESTCYTTHKQLETLQEKAVKYIDNSLNKKLTINNLYVLYNIQPLKMQWREHYVVLCIGKASCMLN